MKTRSIIAVLLLLVAGLQTSWAQGFRVYKSDGTVAQFSMRADSIVFYDGIGTFFNLSSHYDMCYKVDGKYTQNDSGIALDHSFPFENGNWYDPNAVDNFIKSL